MPAIVNAAAHRLEKSTGGTATNAGNLSLPQPPVALPTSPTELVDEVPTEFGGLTHLFGGGSVGEALSQYVPINTALEKPGGSIRGALGGLKPDFRSAAQKVQEAIPATGGGTPIPHNPAPGQYRAVATTYFRRVRGWLGLG